MKRARFLYMIIVVFAMLFSGPGVIAQKKPVIGVAGISHESNSFSKQKTTLEDFGVRLGETPDGKDQKIFFLG